MKVVYYVVDYDVPVEKRYGFYKKLNRISKKYGGYIVKSTLSVVITTSRKFAEDIYNLVHEFEGKANIYEARRIV